MVWNGRKHQWLRKKKKKRTRAASPTKGLIACCTRRHDSAFSRHSSTHPEGLSFGELTRLCDLTDGNLSRHLDVLTEADLVKIKKGFEGRRPHTSCTLTASGRKRFREYLAQLEKVLHDAAAQKVPGPRDEHAQG